ncbi:MAG: ATP-binding cassette domain-containing protein [Pygmaiobacter sp.]
MLTLEHITKTFNAGTVNERCALSDFSLTLEDGEFVTVIGGNGAGKSTLFNAIGGTFFVDEGRVLLGDADVTFVPAARRSREIGRILQDPLLGTAPHMTIEENLTLAYMQCKRLHGFGLGKKEKNLFREKLSSLGLGLEDRMDSPVGLLSGGQRQALTLLMATIVPPKLLLLDEHTAALDPATAEKVLALTRAVVDENQLTCMMITHNIESALRMGTRTIMLEEGRLVLDITGDERRNMTIEGLLAKFRSSLDNDRMLLGTATFSEANMPRDLHKQH